VSDPNGARALEVIDLARRFGDVVALDHVSFRVEAGEMVGFVGPNGAGKTTAMRIALGVLHGDAGEVRWLGRPVDAETRRRFGYMPEQRGLYPKMRVAGAARRRRLKSINPRRAARCRTRCPRDPP